MLFDNAYQVCNCSGIVRVSDLIEYTGFAKATIYSYLREFSDSYEIDRGIVIQKSEVQP